jgi:hypothetical protein
MPRLRATSSPTMLCSNPLPRDKAATRTIAVASLPGGGQLFELLALPPLRPAAAF